MRLFLYAASVLALLSAGLANVMNRPAGLQWFSAASASLVANTPIYQVIERTLCGGPTPAPNKKWVTPR